MKRRTLVLGVALLTSMVSAGEVSACVYLPVVEIGGGVSQRERAAEERRFAREALSRKPGAAKQALADGANAPLEIAEMVIPNVRPIFIERSTCGIENEIDLAEGEASWDDWLIGSRFAGRSDEFWGILREFGIEALGSDCNAEVRARFAALLGRRLTDKHLRDAYLFLAAHRSGSLPLRRLMAFEGQSRRPPVRWLGAEFDKWTERKAGGRALQQAIESFWSEQMPLLNDPERLCPSAAARWQGDRFRILEQIEVELVERETLRELRQPR